MRTKKPKNPEPRFRFRNFHFGLASDPLHCCHIQEARGLVSHLWLKSLKKTLKTQELSQKRKKMQSLNNRRRLKQKRKRVALRIRRSLPRSLRGGRKEAETKKKAAMAMDVFEGEAKLQKKK